ncbi:MAG: hypothetical protein JXI43_12325 [Tissierellales bacterium]|nr:hypothetical protein [Tissierellales bacterium]
MKKIITMMLCIVIFLLMIMSGCSKNSLKTYQDAVAKTDTINRGQSRISIMIENQFNKEDLSEELKTTLEALESLEMSLLSSFDKSEDLSVHNAYLKAGSLGYDIKIFQKGEEAYLKMPMLNRYIRLDMSVLEANAPKDLQIPENLIQRITQEWVNLLETDNVVKGQKSIMSTEDGEVKVTKFTVTPTEDQFRLFIKKMIGIVKSEKGGFETFIEAVDMEEKIIIEELLLAIESEINEMETITFNSVAYIDIDGYIVKESIEIYFENYDPSVGQTYTRTVRIEEENWDNEMAQEIMIPEISDEDIIEPNEIENLMMKP